jgi:hypothetical protein
VVSLNFADDPAAAHHQNAVADADQLRHFGRDDDDRAPFRSQSGDEFVDLFLVADIDAARRLVDDDNLRIEQHHLGKQQLLLVAAGKLSCEDRLRAGPDVEILDRLVERLCFPLAIDLQATDELAERGERQVDGQVLGQEQALALTVLGQIGDARLEARMHVGKLNRPAP